ncbi:excalibur calcium-binding domain-containing protein [Streptomyces sp. NPDC055085]
MAKIVTVVVGLVIGFIALGGVLDACGAGDEEPRQPPTSSTTEPASPTTQDPASPTPTQEPEQPAVTVTQTATVSETATVTPEPTDLTTSAPAAGAFYENCDAARAAGAAPLHRGDPGYRDELDRDGDGVACEPYAGP